MDLQTMLAMTENPEYVTLWDRMCALRDEQGNLKVHHYRKGMDLSELTADDRRFDELEQEIQAIHKRMDKIVDKFLTQG